MSGAQNISEKAGDPKSGPILTDNPLRVRVGQGNNMRHCIDR